MMQKRKSLKTPQIVPQGAIQWVHILKGHVQKTEWARDNQEGEQESCCESEWLEVVERNEEVRESQKRDILSERELESTLAAY